MITSYLPISTSDTLPGQPVERERLACEPQRVQRKRTKGWKMPPNTVSVCRPGKWGNPFQVGKPATHVPAAFQGHIARDVTEAVEFYRSMLLQNGLPSGCELSELRGKSLACWCKIGTPCHADVLLHLANM